MSYRRCSSVLIVDFERSFSQGNGPDHGFV